MATKMGFVGRQVLKPLLYALAHDTPCKCLLSRADNGLWLVDLGQKLLLNMLLCLLQLVGRV